VELELTDFATRETRLLFTVIVAVFAVRQIALILRSNRGASAHVESGATELAAERVAKLPILYVASWVGALGEVWLMPSQALAPVAALGLALLAFAALVRHQTQSAAGEGWTYRRFGDPPRPAAPPSSLIPEPDVAAIRADVVGVPLLHGAVISGLTCFVLATAWQRGLASDLEDAGNAPQ